MIVTVPLAALPAALQDMVAVSPVVHCVLLPGAKIDKLACASIVNEVELRVHKAKKSPNIFIKLKNNLFGCFF